MSLNGLNGPVSQRLKIKGLLADRFSKQLEQSYIRDGHAEMLRNVPCEMTFETNKGFVSHESSEHDYLPVFHLMGRVTEIIGDFPYNVHTIYFDPSDSRYLSKDIRYYPSPDEIAHMVQTGGFFTKHFSVPNIMATNRYNFPVMVDLIVLPPDGISSGSENDVDKMMFPIVYVKLKGTGVDNKTDRLLKYYGIESDPEFESYNMTAEASGYTDPPLMQYIEAPEIPKEVEEVRSSDYYISEEEEHQLMQFKEQQELPVQEEEAAVDGPVVPVSDYDMVLANAGMNIARRVEAKRSLQRQRQADAHRHHEMMMHPEYQDEDVHHDEFAADHGQSYDEIDRLNVDEPVVKTSVTEAVAKPVTESVKTLSVETESGYNMVDDVFAEEDVSEVHEEVDQPVEQSVVEDVFAEPVTETQDAVQTGEPEKPELYKKFEMHGAEPVGDAVKRTKTGETLMVFDDEDDMYDDYADANNIDQESANGSDVSDANAQTKLNEANLTKLSRDVAVDRQEDIAAEDSEKKSEEKFDQNHNSEKAGRNSKPSTREVSAMLMDIADQYDTMQEQDEDSEQFD